MFVILTTTRESITGPFLYSDYYGEEIFDRGQKNIYQTTFLNEFACLPVVGRLAGLIRMALAVIHIIGHCFAMLGTLDKGHLFHAAKGACEFARGAIEIIPIIGFIFSMNTTSIYPLDFRSICYYDCDLDRDPKTTGFFFLIKIYNPRHADLVDRYCTWYRRDIPVYPLS